VDAERFDTLSRWLGTTTRSRRRALQLLVGGGALASLATTARAANGRRDKSDGEARSQSDRNRRTRQFQCRPSGIDCRITKKKSRLTPDLCKRCCETFRPLTAIPGEDRGRCCKPNGLRCEHAGECCLDECIAGLCQNSFIQLPPPAPPVPPPCVPYGQACTQSAECCNGVPCSGALCQVPPPAPPTPPPCVPYGQACTQSAECCNGVPCSGRLCRFN
jgi:hypothetical protein